MDPGDSETRLALPFSHPTGSCGFAPGAMLADRYRIVSLLGRGGMGEVYRADDLRLGQPVALKFLPLTLERDPTAREHLLTEVRNARTVSHPNVCRVYDLGEVNGRVFLTMEYIDGEDLASLLRRIGRLPAGKALEVSRQLCAGLGAAHDKGVLHRDLKPANVMIDGRGQARITDFGVAVEAAVALARHDFAGTAAYMAPERLQGAPASVQSDLYALGLILYETYTGKPAFKAGTLLEWQEAHALSAPISPAALVNDIEPAVDSAILRCLEKDPSKRPASAAQVAAALPGGDPLEAAIAAGETPSPELVAASGEEGTLPRRKAWLWLAACIVGVLTVPITFIPFSLAGQIETRAPADLQVRARQLIEKLGYRDIPFDSEWWIRKNDPYVNSLDEKKPSEAPGETVGSTPAPLIFCYRQSSRSLTPWSISGQVSESDPPPEPGDAYVEMDLGGRLLALRAVPPRADHSEPSHPVAYAATATPPSAVVNWADLFDAARLGPPDGFREVAPERRLEMAVPEAREGLVQGQPVHAEAMAQAGRTIFFTWELPGQAPGQLPAASVSAPRQLGKGSVPAPTAPVQAVLLALWISLLPLAAFARRNVRLGRTDRDAARTLAVALVIAWTPGLLLHVDSPAALLDMVNRWFLAMPLVFGLFGWLAYTGFEPHFRRAWPHLLITSTRLLKGRWRDPLVGRAVLAGTLIGLLAALPGSLWMCRWLDLPGGRPTNFSPGSLNGVASYVAMQSFWLAGSLLQVVVWLAVLLIARLVVRRSNVAWAVLALLMVAFGYLSIGVVRTQAMDPSVRLAAAAFFWLLFVWVLWKHGALALTVAFFVEFLVEYAPWTLDASRWYFWRGPFVAATIAALALWGFRNTLGRQSIFPAGALD